MSTSPKQPQEYKWVPDKTPGVEQAEAVGKDHEPGLRRSPAGFKYRPSELLVEQDRLAEVEAELDRGLATRPLAVEELPQTSLVHLRLPEEFRGKKFFDFTERLRASIGGVHYNRVMVAGSHPEPVPAGSPEPGEAPHFRVASSTEPAAGSGVTVYVLDSGIEAGFEGVSAPPSDIDPPGASPLETFKGHATFIAGLIKQCAPGATQVHVKVLNPYGIVDDTTLNRHLTNLLLPDVQIDILNLSFAGPAEATSGTVPASGPALETLLKARPGLVVVGGAGNDSVTDPWWPASQPGVFGVAALDKAGKKGACFTNHGPWVTLCTIGENLHSTFPRFTGTLKPPQGPIPHRCFPGQDQKFFAKSHDFQRGGATWNGTSFAAARVSGKIAAAATPGGARQVANALLTGSRFIDSDGRDLGVKVDCGC